MSQPKYQAPSDCPVCGGDLITTRVGCRNCGSELVGEFAHCDFCGLDERETEVLRVFLASRGNLREVEKHLGVSYPTARARFTALLTKLGLGGAEPGPAVLSREQVLAEVASGALSPQEAAELLSELA
ncbi:MAG: hypothetical protein CVT62_03730 [Actinobacteria bacterium HGW-Actinobacteria-2]|nr:MAG: hypothetical protein CVT62_03730 [Actinobacteria bacterium HGW-Actinobacteria-2]